MRNPASGPGESIVASALSPVAEARLAAIAEALAAERANVYLEPILQLAEEQARHFEVSVRLSDADGTDLDARQISARAGNAEVLTLLDAIGLRHAAGFALKLERRGRDGSVFSEIAGHSLANEGFVNDASGRHAQGIADRLVLTFQQSEMRALGPAQLAALGDLARLGFRFALQGVADLDMDFEALRNHGLSFVKLDAEVFLNGLIAGGEEVPASDICRFFDEMGLHVIVSGIDNDVLRQRIAGCGVSFGQGLVFGQPRPIPVGMPATGIAA
jgi:cyclic-di-GMP phosphodiesterase TipF (flagellum assembly factor)